MGEAEEGQTEIQLLLTQMRTVADESEGLR